MKIAVYASLFFENPMSEHLQYKGSVTQHNLLGHVKCANAMFRTAKKYFLKNHDIEFILITNVSNIEEFGIDTDLINLIKVEYNSITSLQHAHLMKILSIEFLDTTKYERMYSVETDCIFINEVVDDDLLPYNMVAQRHWAKTEAGYGRVWWNTCAFPVEEYVNFDPNTPGIEWVMGNFYGGKSELLKDMMEKTKALHIKWTDIVNSEGPSFYTGKTHNWPFYALYPEELFLGKYIHENVKDVKLLEGIFDLEEEIDREKCNAPDGFYCLPGWGVYLRSDRTKQYWLSELKANESLYPNITLAKLLHATKSNFQLLDKVLPYYI